MFFFVIGPPGPDVPAADGTEATDKDDDGRFDLSFDSDDETGAGCKFTVTRTIDTDKTCTIATSNLCHECTDDTNKASTRLKTNLNKRFRKKVGLVDNVKKPANSTLKQSFAALKEEAHCARVSNRELYRDLETSAKTIHTKHYTDYRCAGCDLKRIICVNSLCCECEMCLQYVTFVSGCLEAVREFRRNSDDDSRW